MDIFPLIRPYAANVGCVWKLLFIVIRVIQRLAPITRLAGEQLLPRPAVDVREGFGSANIENARCQVNVHDHFVDDCTGPDKPGVSD